MLFQGEIITQKFFFKMKIQNDTRAGLNNDTKSLLLYKKQNQDVLNVLIFVQMMMYSRQLPNYLNVL